MLLGNVLARLVAILHLLLCSNLRFDQLKTSGTWDWNSTPFVCLASGEDGFGVSLISLQMRILSFGSLLQGYTSPSVLPLLSHRLEFWARFRKPFHCVIAGFWNFPGFHLSVPLGFLWTKFSVEPVASTFKGLFMYLLNKCRDESKLRFLVNFLLVLHCRFFFNCLL